MQSIVHRIKKKNLSKGFNSRLTSFSTQRSSLYKYADKTNQAGERFVKLSIDLNWCDIVLFARTPRYQINMDVFGSRKTDSRKTEEINRWISDRFAVAGPLEWSDK